MRALYVLRSPLFQMPLVIRAVVVLSLCAAFLFYKYMLQNFPSVMANQLMDAFHLRGLGLGVLSGVYFWAYLIVPLFVGILLDRYGTRWIVSAALLCCALGIFIFSQAEQLNTAILGRTLIGVGVSFATISYLKLASIWFSKQHYALLTSLLVTAGMLGAVCGQMPLAWLVQQVGWRNSLWNLGCLGLGLAALFALFVRDHNPALTQSSNQNQRSQHLWKEIVVIFKKKQNWLLTGYSGLAFAPVVIFCGLWGTPFLQQAYLLDKLSASSLVSMVFVGLGVGSPLFALFTKTLRKPCTLMFYSTLLSAASLAIVIYIPFLPIGVLATLLFLFGFSLGAFPLVFVIGKESNPLYLAGTVISLINASDAFLDAITEPVIGLLLDGFSGVNVAQEFSLFGYYLALAILPLYQIIGAMLLRWVK